MTLTQARKEARRFLEPINDVVEGSEHGSKTMAHLIAVWNESVKPTLKLSTQLSYEWLLDGSGRRSIVYRFP